MGYSDISNIIISTIVPRENDLSIKCLRNSKFIIICYSSVVITFLFLLVFKGTDLIWLLFFGGQ